MKKSVSRESRRFSTKTLAIIGLILLIVSFLIVSLFILLGQSQESNETPFTVITGEVTGGSSPKFCLDTDVSKGSNQKSYSGVTVAVDEQGNLLPISKDYCDPDASNLRVKEFSCDSSGNIQETETPCASSQTCRASHACVPVKICDAQKKNCYYL